MPSTFLVDDLPPIPLLFSKKSNLLFKKYFKVAALKPVPIFLSDIHNYV